MKKANCKMAMETLGKLTFQLYFVVTEDFIVDNVYYRGIESFPTDKEMDNLKIFIAEIRETVLRGKQSMKYIRTKDGRIITPIANEDIFDTNETKNGENVLKVSDRLEDLFDEQIVEYKDENGKVIKREFVNHIYDGEIPEGEPEYYGAIRTETGLRYVARKIGGEWKLI